MAGLLTTPGSASRLSASERPAPGCPACGGIGSWAPTYADLRRCAGCGFVAFHGSQPADLERLYDESYFNGSEYVDYLGQEQALRRSMRRHLVQMARYAPLRGALLEVGCAYGLFLDEARVHFSNVTGIDVCAAPVAHARAALRLDARRGDFLTEDWGGRTFDVVCLWDTVEHLSAPDRFVRRAAEVLAPRGSLFLTTCDIGSRNARRRGPRWRQIHPPTHVSYFSRSTVALMLERSGFEVIGFETAAYFHTLFNVLASLRLRGGPGALVARPLLSMLGERLPRRIGAWVDIGDTMFVAARRSGGRPAEAS